MITLTSTTVENSTLNLIILGIVIGFIVTAYLFFVMGKEVAEREEEIRRAKKRHPATRSKQETSDYDWPDVGWRGE